MTKTLEETLQAICAEYDLTTLMVGYCNPLSSGRQFSANCHWEGVSRRGFNCTTANAADIKTAVEDVLVAMLEDRGTSEVPTLPAFEAVQS